MNVMNIMSTPEMIRTNPAHAGTAPLSSLRPGKEVINTSPSEIQKGSFADYLVKAVSDVNDKQLDVNRVTEQLITDPDSVDIHDVTTAMAKAQMSLSLAQTVIDRLVTGWNELSTNR